MALPDKLSKTDLLKNDYVIDPNDSMHAKHKRYNSLRHCCTSCNIWFKQTWNNKCKKCLIKSN